jgi:hypothetical protein
MQTKPEFRVRLDGVIIPEVRVQCAPEGGLEIAVRGCGDWVVCDYG